MEFLSSLLLLVKETSVLNNVFLVAFFVIFGIAFWKENKDQKSPLRWIDPLVDTKTNRLSITKLGQFIGLAVSTWIIIYLVQVPAAYSIFTGVFFGWLSFLLGAWCFNKYIDTANKKDDKHD